MSTMFKSLFKNKQREKSDHERHITDREKNALPSSPHVMEEIHDKPFDIDLEDLSSYEEKELQGFIRKYEQFTNWMKSKYNDMLSEYVTIREKLHLMDEERKRLVNENEQSMVQVEALKKSLDEKLATMNTVDLHTTQFSSPPRKEEKVMDFAGLDEDNDNVIQEMRLRAEKLIGELNKEVKKEEKVETNNDNEEENHNEEEVAEEDADKETVEKKDSSANVEEELRKIIESYAEAFENAKSRAYKVRNEEHERQVQGLKEEVKRAQMNLDEVVGKLENEKKKLEEVHLSFNEEREKLSEAIKKRESRIEELETMVNALKEDIEKTETRIKEVEQEKSEAQGKFNKIQGEYQQKLVDKEKIETELNKELYAVTKSLEETEEERKKFEKKYNSTEAKRNDTENALIQEKLKHHQTSGDFERAKEKLAELEKSLNEEVDARKADIRKNEDLRRHLGEMERKLKEHRKVINKLSEQVMDLEGSGGVSRENPERLEKTGGTEGSPSYRTRSEQGSTDRGENVVVDIGVQDYMEKALLINAQCAKIQQLEGKLEEALTEAKSLQNQNEKLKEEKEGLGCQVKVLQEKRETGLQEIRRLSSLLEASKNCRVLTETSVQVEKKNGKADESLKLIRRFSVNNEVIRGNGRNGGNEDFECLSKLRQGLEEVYKDIIMAITNEKLQESRSDRKPVGKLGQLVKGPLPSESFMKIEKKLNDMIVGFQEFMENFE